ncbi:YfgM family protein [Aliikangiella coralliicola]|uniref:YfgM family protein n=1 Tax=Aliikangiella coralliicola TaxID=2592383 RepID=UPI00143D206F|nr:tetratricopeptide repeat protein [Aliikangiella coralliicola]
MSYDTEEQQVEKLKEWWSDNGTPLIVGAVLGLAGFGGWKYWTEQEVAYQEAASDLYIKVTDSLKTEEKEGLTENALAVKSQYPESSYAILAAFQLAKQAVEADDLSKAVAELTWVVDNHAGNELAAIAKIRLARIFIQQDKAQQALTLVSLDEESGYYTLASLVKGDALMALERKTEALEAYKVASADTAISARHPSLQVKIDELNKTDAAFISKEVSETAAKAEATATSQDETSAESETESKEPQEAAK